MYTLGAEWLLQEQNDKNTTIYPQETRDIETETNKIKIPASAQEQAGGSGRNNYIKVTR